MLGSMGGLPGIDTAIATPTEAGAMGVMGALLLAALHKRLTRPLVWDAMLGTMRLTAMVVFILIGARVFSLVFQGVDGARWVEHILEISMAFHLKLETVALVTYLLCTMGLEKLK